MSVSLSTPAVSLRAKVALSGQALRPRAAVLRGCVSRPLAVASNEDQAPVDVRRTVMASVAALSVVASCQFGSVAFAAETSKSRGVAGQTGLTAVAELVSTEGNTITGTVKITEITNKYGRPLTTIAVEAAGLAPGTHGINIHEIGDVTCSDGACTGKSYNPDGRPHGSPTSTKGFGASTGHYLGDGRLFWRHVGDVGNIKAGEDGVVHYTLSDELAKLSGEFDITGKSVVIHARADDFETDKDDGNAGPIIAYGTIKKL